MEGPVPREQRRPDPETDRSDPVGMLRIEIAFEVTDRSGGKNILLRFETEGVGAVPTHEEALERLDQARRILLGLWVLIKGPGSSYATLERTHPTLIQDEFLGHQTEKAK